MSSRHFAKNPLGHPRRTETAVGSDGGIFDQTGEIKNAFKAPPPPTREADCVKPSNLMLRPNGHNTASAARALSMVEAIAAAKPQGSKPTPVPAISSRWTSRLSTTPATAPAETSSVSDPIVWGDLLEEHVMEHWQETRHRDVEPSQEQSTFDSVRDTAAPAETSPVSEPQAMGTFSIFELSQEHCKFDSVRDTTAEAEALPVSKPRATITLSTPLVLVDGQETHDTSFDRSKEESKIDSARTTLSAEPAPVFGPHALETTLPEPLDSDDEHAIANSKIPFNPNADVPVPSTEEARLRDHRALVRQISSRLTRDGDATDDDVAQEIFSR
jgi:hypothetical protein